MTGGSSTSTSTRMDRAPSLRHSPSDVPTGGDGGKDPSNSPGRVGGNRGAVRPVVQTYAGVVRPTVCRRVQVPPTTTAPVVLDRVVGSVSTHRSVTGPGQGKGKKQHPHHTGPTAGFCVHSVLVRTVLGPTVVPHGARDHPSSPGTGYTFGCEVSRVSSAWVRVHHTSCRNGESGRRMTVPPTVERLRKTFAKLLCRGWRTAVRS